MNLYPHGHMVNIQKMNLGNFIEKRSLGAFFYCPRSRFFFQFDRGIKALKRKLKLFSRLEYMGMGQNLLFLLYKKGDQHPFTNYLRFHQGMGF